MKINKFYTSIKKLENTLFQIFEWVAEYNLRKGAQEVSNSNGATKHHPVTLRTVPGDP